MRFPIPSPDDALFRVMFYVGVPFLVVIFFHSIYQFVQWLKVVVLILQGAEFTAARVMELARTRLGVACQAIVAHVLAIISGVYVAQCFQYVVGVRYEGSTEARNFQAPPIPEESFQMLASFRPFESTYEVVWLLVILAVLSIV